MFDQIGLDVVFEEHQRRVAQVDAVAWQLAPQPAPHPVRLGTARALLILATWLSPVTGEELLAGQVVLKPSRS